MAAPGLGIGDIINACNYIWTKCRQYKDSVKEFDEIASKAKSTTVVIKRLDDEARRNGSLVQRAGPEAFEQLEDNLQSLREDAQRLQDLVEKYDSIHDILGRRLLFTFREADNLTDLRRRIGLHEQQLQFWYTTLVYGSLRRLENGQEEIFEAIKTMNKDTLAAVIGELRRGNDKALKKELRKQGIPKESIEENISIAKSYVTAPPVEKARLETQARTRRSHEGEGGSYEDNGDHSASPFISLNKGHRPKTDTEFDAQFSERPLYLKVNKKYVDKRTLDHFALPWEWDKRDPNYIIIKKCIPEQEQDAMFEHTRVLRKADKDINSLLESDRIMLLHRKKAENVATAATNQHRFKSTDGDKLHITRNTSAEGSLAPMPPSSAHRRSSDAAARPKPNPLLVVPQVKPSQRPASYHGPNEPDRSTPNFFDDFHNYEQNRDAEILKVELMGRPRGSYHEDGKPRSRSRQSSTHSYHRRRPSTREASRDREELRNDREATMREKERLRDDRIRMVERMDRIDSMNL